MSLENLLNKYSIKEEHQKLNWVGSFSDYLNIVKENPGVVRNAYQRVYDMIVEEGYEDYEELRKSYRRWKFFDDRKGGGKDSIFGLDEQLNKFVELLKGAALGYGVEKRILLLHGPVGSSKSTIARLLKKGLERYSKTTQGALYTFQWYLDGEWVDCPMNEEPLKLVPEEFREDFVKDLLQESKLDYPVTSHRGDLNPACRKNYNLALKECDGDWKALVSQRIRVKRLVISEKDRVGIGTYQPKDEKSQDATELTGDINYRKIATYGSDSDPRAFNFDGEFNVANRGIIEFIEVLKLETAFLYDLLGATQERKIKPRKFAQTDIDEVIIGHTNNPEYRKLQNNEMMEAFRDRTIQVDIGYNLKLDNEVRIYKRDFQNSPKHIAPHTLDVVSMFAVLTRLTEPKNGNISLLQKMKLYNGKSLPGFTADSVQELLTEGKAEGEGMKGISPRFVQDKISNALAKERYTHINPFIVMNELEDGLDSNALISDKTQRERYKHLLADVRDEYTEMVKNEVQRAICADEEAIARLCANYIENIKAYSQKEKIKNPYTGRDEEPDEKFMRSIEEKVDISESKKEDFRKSLLNYIGALAIEGKKFHYWSNERLNRALELKLFEDSRHTVKLNSLLTNVIDAETQEKIEIVKSRLIKNYGYNAESAQDVLNYVASIYSRGDKTE